MRVAPGLVLVALAAGAASLWASGCHSCFDIGCGMPFNWSAVAAGGLALPFGSYTFAVAVEGAEPREFSCVLDAEHESCSPGVGDGDNAPVIRLHAGPSGFKLGVQANAQSDYSCRGPTSVHISIAYEGQTLVEDEYDRLLFERDHDFRGPRCGYADELPEFQIEFESPTAG